MLEKSYYSKMRAILPETVSLIFDENGTEDLQSELLCIVGNLIDAEIQEGKLEDIDAINACIAEYDVFGEIVEQENEKIIQEMENQIGQNDWGAVYNFYLFLKGRACSQEEIAKYESLYIDAINARSEEELKELIAIAVVLSKSGDKILCVKKTEKSTKSDSPESGQTLLYVGGHMRKEDESRECHNFLDVLRNTLQREILEELGISLVISKEEIPFVIYTPDNEKSKKHLAIGWKVYIDEETKLRLDSYELVQKKGKSKSGTFVSFDNVTDSDIKLESWSRTILLDILSDKLTDTQRLILQCSDSNQIRLDV